MVTGELGACEWFVWDLRRSNLIDRGQLDQVVGEFLQRYPRAEPPVLAEFLVAQGVLSQFQADRLLQGKTQGFVLGPFTLMDALGAGSMGTVYKAQSKTDSKWYAVKVLPRRSMWNVRIARRKVRSFEQCRHPSVIPFVDVGTSGGMHYLAWPLVEGEPLDKLVQRAGKLSSGQAAKYALQVAEGLEVCHAQTLFHGLLKPSNLMIGCDDQVFILDFGIGCLLAETEGESLVDTMSTANSVASGLDCASPESIMDPTNLTPAGDQYSLGCVLYYCLTGQYPFPDGSAAEKMMAHQFKEPTPVSELALEVPRKLVEVVARLMQKAPESRYENVSEVADALRPFAESALPAPRSQGRPAPARRVLPEPRQPAPVPEAPGAAVPAAEEAQRGVSPALSAAQHGAPPSVPNRETLRGGPAAAPVRSPAPVPTPARTAEPPRERAIPGNVEGSYEVSWEERLGPTGIAVGAVLACALAWLLTWGLFQ
jgi:serine/threonine-protein kinase